MTKTKQTGFKYAIKTPNTRIEIYAANDRAAVAAAKTLTDTFGVSRDQRYARGNEIYIQPKTIYLLLNGFEHYDLCD